MPGGAAPGVAKPRVLKKMIKVQAALPQQMPLNQQEISHTVLRGAGITVNICVTAAV